MGCNSIKTTDTASKSMQEESVSAEEYFSSAENEPSNDTGKMAATVSKFVDGDTTYFSIDGQEIKVRYLLIDTPETSSKQPFSAEAKARTEELLTNAGTIQLEYDIGAKQDHYNRDLMYVWADGQLVQEILAREGLCIVRYVEAPNTRYLEQVKAAENQAQAEGLGIWSIENYAEEDSGYSSTNSQNSAQSAPQTGTEKIVYVTPSGTKYHYTDTCRGLSNANSTSTMTEADAIENSYSLCGFED